MHDCLGHGRAAMVGQQGWWMWMMTRQCRDWGRRRQKRSVDFRLGLDGGKRQTIGGQNAN